MSRHLYIGPLTDEVWQVLKYTWKFGLALQCDYARSHAQEVALCASQGWVSCVDPDGKSYRPRWRITSIGLALLQHKEALK